MKRVWCDLCGKPITDMTYIKVEINEVDSEYENTLHIVSGDITEKPLEVHKECIIEAFSDFQGKKKLPESPTTSIQKN